MILKYAVECPACECDAVVTVDSDGDWLDCFECGEVGYLV